MAAQPDDEAILAALDTTPEAFAVFYRRHVAGLLGYFLRRTRDAEVAADLCAETFAAALEGAHRFDAACCPTRSGAAPSRTARAAGSGWRRWT